MSTSTVVNVLYTPSERWKEPCVRAIVALPATEGVVIVYAMADAVAEDAAAETVGGDKEADVKALADAVSAANVVHADCARNAEPELGSTLSVYTVSVLSHWPVTTTALASTTLTEGMKPILSVATSGELYSPLASWSTPCGMEKAYVPGTSPDVRSGYV